MIKKIAASFIIVTLLSFSLLNNFRELVFEKLNAYANNYPEKVYIQTDKPYYVTGENIWYTVYLVNGINHKKTDKSHIIYVELINKNDSILSKKQLYTNNISVAGDFEIKKEWKPGKYLIRAYSNYMRNSDSGFIFKKEISIFNIEINDTENQLISNLNENNKTDFDERKTTLPEIYFYPEGGYIVNGIPCKVAIKIKDKQNRNIAIEGVIKNSDNELVSTFKTQEFGLGLVNIVTEANKTYYASIFINGQEVQIPLPKALPKGYNLSLANNGNQIILKVTANNEIGLKNSFLIAHQRGKIIFEKLETQNINTYSIKLSTNDLQDGVANVTLFNNDGNPVCERLVFIDNPNNKVSINVSKSKDDYKTRDKVTLQINLKDKIGNPVFGNLSMAVTDLNVVGKNTNSENIKTYLLLNSDLRGYIESPGYFFEKENDPKRRYMLDLVMLTHGWSRFTWNDILYNNRPINNQFNIEKGIYISGRTSILKETGNQISAATRLTFMGGVPYQELKQSDANGMFKFGPYVFSDSIPTLIEARLKDFNSDDDRKNRFVEIDLIENFSSSPKIDRKNVLMPSIDDQIKVNNFLKQSQTISKIDAEFLESARILDEVIITAKNTSDKDKRNKLLNDRTDYGFPSNRLDLNDIPNSESLSVFDLLNRLPGVMAFNDSISIRNGGIPKIYLDGMQVQLEDISSLRGSQIEFIDVLKGADAATFSNAGNGVIAIHSKTGAFVRNINVKRKPGITDFQAIGFYTAREFYAPDHINSGEEFFKQDIRPTLHWAPNIQLTENKQTAEISFFTSDIQSKYAIEIEGITEDGIPVYNLSTIEIE